jgi:hypothetical protein
MMDAEVAFRFMSVDLDYNKVIGVLVSVIVGVQGTIDEQIPSLTSLTSVLFVAGPRLLD